MQKAKYIGIDGNKATIYNTDEYKTYYDTLLMDCSYSVDSGALIIEGSKIDYGLVLERTLVSDLKYEPNKPIYGYFYPILDWLFRIKRYYVKGGWYRLKETIPIKISIKDYIIIEYPSKS